jgi:hypothetical protein
VRKMFLIRMPIVYIEEEIDIDLAVYLLREGV